MNTLTQAGMRPDLAGDHTSQVPVFAAMSYLKPTTQRPCSYAFPPPPGIPWENCAYELRTVPIYDGRHAPVKPSIEHEGYELWDAPSSVKNFMDADEVAAIYYAEARELALAVTGASKARVFDHLVRRREADHAALSFGKRGADGLAAANGRIHNDYSEGSGRNRLNLVITDPDEAARVRRYSIINIWRPIKGPVLDTPLALGDARTFMASELVAGDVKYPRRTGEIYLATYSDAHRWSYFSRMERHEALVFKQYDSQLSGVSRFTPHSAFDHPDTPAGTPPRESIELRCLVTYE